MSRRRLSRTLHPLASYTISPNFGDAQAKENADELLEEKAALEKEQKALAATAAEKDKVLQTKIKTIGNLVHSSVPVHNNEVSWGFIKLGSGSLLVDILPTRLD